MKTTKYGIISATATIALVTTMAFAQSATTTVIPTQADIKSAKATLQADYKQLTSDRKDYRIALKANDTATTATLKAKIADDRTKINQDAKTLNDLRKAVGKKTKEENNDGKMDKKDKNGKDKETKDDGIKATGTKSTTTNFR